MIKTANSNRLIGMIDMRGSIMHYHIMSMHSKLHIKSVNEH